MAKIYPNSATSSESSSTETTEEPTTLTVWRKSLLFNGNGFTVYDQRGNLLFRVDNYSCTKMSEIVLMDASGKPLLSVYRKRLSLRDQWLVYKGEEFKSPILSVKKERVGFFNSKILARVAALDGEVCGYDVEGSFSQRSCAIYDLHRRLVAEIKGKESAGGVRFGGDVFRLVVFPGLDSAVAMAIVILLDQMF